MFRLFFWCFLAPVFAALPIVKVMPCEPCTEIPNSNTNSEEPFGYFSLIGDSESTPFRLQIIFENCNELRDNYGHALPLTVLKLKYIDTQSASSWKEITLKLAGKGQNCIHNFEFYNDVQERYDMEIWASWNKTKSYAGGIYEGRVSFNILPKP
jgi:hypothetical protein